MAVEITLTIALAVMNIWMPGWIARLCIPIVCFVIGKYGMTEEVDDDE